MTWKRKNLVAAGRLSPPMGMCPSCSADLVPTFMEQRRFVKKGAYCVYVCSRKGCVYEKRAVPRSSEPYGGPKKK